MKDKNYISVSEYAALKGISKQAVYKQLNNKLKNFLIEVDGKKFLDLSVLTEEERKKVEAVEQPQNQQFDNQFQPVEQPKENQIQPLLESQLAEKDKTIESLLRQIENLQLQNSKLTDMNGQLAELLKNSQVLLAAEKQQQLIEQKQATETAPENGEQTETAPPKEKKKREPWWRKKKK